MAATGLFLTNTITKLEMLRGSDPVGHATGFFLKQQNHWYLITNWHVLSGRHPKTGLPLSSGGAIPDVCRFWIGALQEYGLTWRSVDVPLGDASAGSANWLQHPLLGQVADVAALPLTISKIPLARDLLATDGHDEEMFIDLGGELFIPGYPQGLTAGGMMPLWKRASLASSLEWGDGVNRFFYVDTATREGMSGAPCLAISNWRHYAMDRATNQVRVVQRPLSWRLLGVYSGRLRPGDNFEAQIGIVWRETLILETVSGGSRATVVSA